MRYGIAGAPVPGVEVKLESCPEFIDKAGQPYLTTDRLDVEGDPIWGRGGKVCLYNIIYIYIYIYIVPLIF